MPALMKIRSAYSSLPSAERKVADFILNDPKQASLMVINDIARASNVSAPSVTRLARKLGYDGFMEFRVALAAGGTDPITMETEPLNASDSDEAAIEKMFLSSMRCVEDTMKVLDAKKLARFVDEIVAAHRVAITGLGASGHLAVITAEHLGLLGVDAAATIDEHMIKVRASHLKEGDVMLAVSRTGATKVVNDAIKIAHKNGAKCAMISNNVSSSVSALCDYFFCTARIPDVLELVGRETNISQYVLLETLSFMVSRKLNAGEKF